MLQHITVQLTPFAVGPQAAAVGTAPVTTATHCITRHATNAIEIAHKVFQVFTSYKVIFKAVFNVPGIDVE